MDGNESFRFGPINWAPFPLMAKKMLSLSVTALSYLSSLATHPLFSTILTVYALILLYLPRIFLGLLLSPVPAITAVLLLSLLRLGAIQNKVERRVGSPVKEETGVKADVAELVGFDDAPTNDSCSETDSWSQISGLSGSSCFERSFVEWDVKAPLEVIYEDYEGEEEDDNKHDEYRHGRDAINAGGAWGGIERYASISMCYPDSDSETSSDGDFPVIGDYFESPERDEFQWEEWEEREGLIEIALDLIDDVVEEENMIEIDISPAAARNRQCV